jgi:hypothetical protein
MSRARLVGVFTGVAMVVLAVGLVGCGLASSWSASPVAWQEEESGGAYIWPAGAGDTMRVGEDTVAIYGYIEFWSSDIDADDFSEEMPTAEEAAITERTACTLNGASIEPGTFVNELLSAQDARGNYKLSITYASGEATKVALEAR